MTVVIDFEESHHIARVEEIQRLAFNRGDETRTSRILRRLNGSTSLVASVSGIVFGHVLLFPVASIPSDATAESAAPFDLNVRAVGPISVDPDQQGHGIGRRLVEECIFEARQQGLDALVVPTLEPFWESTGFESSHPFNLFFARANRADPPSGIYWIAEPRTLPSRVDLDYPEPFGRGL